MRFSPSTSAKVQAGEGLGHALLPGRVIRVVVGRRPQRQRSRHTGQREPLPPVETFFSTDLSWSLEAILAQSRDRWAVEIAIRDTYAFAGLGQDQCRKVERLVGANLLRLVLAAARPLWFLERTHHAGGGALGRSRSRYRQKEALSQLDIVWTCREALAEAGVFPIPRFAPDLAETPQEPENTLPLAA
jgi:hypothetical protein